MKKILLGMALACLGLSVSSSAQTVMMQNFEGVTTPALPTGWNNSTTGGGQGWVTNTGAHNWPLYSITAHSTYCLVDDAGHKYNNPSYLTSPTFSLVGVTTPYLAYDWFYIHAWLSGAPYSHEQAWVEISTDGGTNYNFIDSVPGFSSSVTDWATQFVSLATVTPTATCKLRFCYTDQGGSPTSGVIGCAIDNVLVYGASATDLSLTTVAPVAGSVADYFAVGTSATFSGTVTNYNSSTAVSSFTAYYQVGASAPVSQVISTSVPALGTAPFSITPSYSVTAASQQPVKVWVKATGDANVSNDSSNTAVIGYAFAPHKHMLFEEATGTWCGWCVRGIVYMDSLGRAYPNNVNIVSVHNGDPMSSDNTSATKYDQALGGYISGYPSMVIDRRYTDDPSGCFGDYSSDNSLFGFAEMGLKYTTTGGTVNATAKVMPAMDMAGDYRLELIVTEDDVTGTGTSWDQHNYYAVGGAGHSTAMHTVGYDFNNLPSSIPGVKFPFVARTTLPADLNATPNGIAGSLPASMTASTVYTYTFAPVTIKSNWVASKLHVIALLIDNNSNNPTYGNVLNSISTPGLFLGLHDVNSGIQNMEVFPNPASDAAHVRFELSSASTVNFSVVDMVGREVFSAPAEKMNEGGHQINFSTADLASGIYNVIVRTENGTLSSRISIAK